ncbi:hypothetical protein CO641_09805 [Lysobacteraceae bacterium NML91-0213]|nr:hypothetical protein CO641_09805 [Xanthomonadaceae bacterium NML91-0213]
MAEAPVLGRVIEWDDARGFGFIRPHGDERRLFFHIRDYRRSGRRPEIGEFVRFRASRQADGRWCAQDVDRVAQRRRGAVRRAVSTDAPRVGWTAVGPLVAAYLALLTWSVSAGRLPVAAAACVPVLSLLTWLVYAADKRAARERRRRVPEAHLHALELAGGWPGALLAQRVLHHKSRKRSYQVVFWIVVALNVAAVVAWPELAG